MNDKSYGVVFFEIPLYQNNWISHFMWKPHNWEVEYTMQHCMKNFNGTMIRFTLSTFLYTAVGITWSGRRRLKKMKMLCSQSNLRENLQIQHAEWKRMKRTEKTEGRRVGSTLYGSMCQEQGKRPKIIVISRGPRSTLFGKPAPTYLYRVSLRLPPYQFSSNKCTYLPIMT